LCAIALSFKRSVHLARLSFFPATLGREMACNLCSKRPMASGIVGEVVMPEQRVTILAIDRGGIRGLIPSTYLLVWFAKQLSAERKTRLEHRNAAPLLALVD
jgi:hypothetical protein